MIDTKKKSPFLNRWQVLYILIMFGVICPFTFVMEWLMQSPIHRVNGRLGIVHNEFGAAWLALILVTAASIGYVLEWRRLRIKAEKASNK